MTLEQLIKAAAADIGRLPEQIGVKSIQRGTGTIPANQASVNINISAVNQRRCMVLLNASGGYGTITNTGVYASGIYVTGLSDTQLSVARQVTTDATFFSYQIIEFF